jgi:hypothetical protein
MWKGHCCEGGLMNTYNTEESMVQSILVFSCTMVLTVLSAAGDGNTPLQRIHHNNPGLVVDLGVGLWATPFPLDYDSDGDYDLVVSCHGVPYNGIYFFENTDVNTKMPVFEAATRIGPGYKNIQPSYINGRMRLLIPGKEVVGLCSADKPFAGEVQIYPDTQIHRADGHIRANQWKYCDFDGDEDLDLIVGIGDWADYGWDNAYDSSGKWTRGPLHGYVYLIRNVGSTVRPAYEGPTKVLANGEPIDVYGMPSPNVEDFDGDGDLDIICGSFVDVLTYFENVGSRTEPQYATGKLLKGGGKVLKMDLCMITPVAFDWDRDGDMDLIVGEEDGRVALLENTGNIIDSVPSFLGPQYFRQQADYVKFGVLITPFSFDWDADGDEDLICGNSAGYIGFIENVGGHDPPKWAEPRLLEATGTIIRIQAGCNGSIQGPAEAKWGYTTVCVSDWDGDGLPDVLANSIWGKVIWCRNVGSRSQPRLADPQPVEVEWNGRAPKPPWVWWQPHKRDLVTQWRTNPFVCDLNHDNLADLVMLDCEGFLSFFQRGEANGELMLLPPQRIFKTASNKELRLAERTAGASGRRKICLADWDQDGRIDMLINGKNVDFWHNVSPTKDSHVFVEKGPVHTRILAGHTTSPTTVDWDDNDIPDLLVGAEDGHLYYMHNPLANLKQ